MARIIRIKNNLDSQAQSSYLATSQSSGGTSLYVKNINDFTDNYAVQIGATGEETAEIQIISGNPSGTTVNLLGTLKFDHSVDTPVYAIKHNQIKIYRNTSGTTTPATEIDTVNITPDSEFTQYTDVNGNSDYWYRVSYYNQYLSQESELSAWIQGSGFTFTSRAKLRQRIQSKLYDAGYIKDDETINDWINEWLETMNNAAVSLREDFSLGSTTISHGTDGLGTITNNDFIDVRRVWFTTDGQSYYEGNRIESNEYMPSDVFVNTDPKFYYHRDNVIAKLPTGNAGSASVLYYAMPPILDNDDDELPLVMKPYSNSFVNYGLGQAYMLDQKTELAVNFLTLANNDLERFKLNITPRGKTGPKFIQFTDSTSAEDYDYPFFF